MTTSINTVPQLESLLKEKGSSFDVIIIGGGPAGLTCGVYCGRSGLKTLLIERALLGGQVSLCSAVDNYPGFPSGISGVELAGRMEDQAKKFDVEIVWGDVVKISDEGKLKKVDLYDKSFFAPVLVIATGTEPKKLGAPGEVELRGRGVSYCATCDGAFYKEKNIVVVGGGNSAVSEALFLTRFAAKVYIVHRRDSFRSEKILSDRAVSDHKVEVIWNSVVEKINGVEKVESVEVKNVKNGKLSTLPVDGVFIYIGEQPNTAVVKDLISLDEFGEIVVDEKMKTSVSGVFAAGDVCKKGLRQIVTAVSDGAIAADSARKYLENML